MSWKATAYVKELSTDPQGNHLSRSEKLLLLIIADYYNDEQQGAWASIERIAADALMSKRHAQRLLECLRKRTMLEVTHREGRTNIYRFNGYPRHSYVTPDTMSPLTQLCRPPHDIPTHHPRHSYVTPTHDIAMSPEPSVEPSVEPIIEPSLLVAEEIFEFEGKQFRIHLDPYGNERLIPLNQPSNQPTTTRWTINNNDEEDYNGAAILAEYERLTKNQHNKNDMEIAEIIGASFKFSTGAVCYLMREINKRCRKKITTLAYFRTAIREVSHLCETASLSVSRAGELAEVRKAIKQWKEKEQ